jgi:uncharacterized repeat protein (TIGR03803 family)
MLHKQFSRGWIRLVMFAVATLASAPRTEAASKYKVLHSFGKTGDGGGVFAGLVRNTKGSLYGITWSGGSYGYGTVFELTPGPRGKWTETILHNFCKDFPHCTDGTAGFSGVILDNEDSLFGLSSAGTFEMIPEQKGWSFKVIYGNGGGDLLPNNDFGQCNLLLDTAGNLYGPCFSFGKNYDGAISELSPGTHAWKEKNLFDFCLHPRNGACPGGNYPEYQLTWDPAGNLYGVTTEGGVDKRGVAFELEHTASGWKEGVLYDFGYIPGSALIFDTSGNLYGTTFQEGSCDGTVYQLSPQGKSRWKRTILYPFCNPVQNGGAPVEPVTLDPRTGVLYGTASAGGDPVCQCGVIFKLTPIANGKWEYTVLHRFRGPDGLGPNGLTIDAKGNLYGTTVAGGKYGYGVAFQFTP